MRGMFAESMTIGDAIAWGAELLEESDAPIRNSRVDATLLLRFVLDIPHAELLAYRERPLTRAQTERFNALIQQRRTCKPIQYITGVQEFLGLEFRATPDVLIPRPETEHLVEAAIERLRDCEAPRIADVGTGSGCIAVALAHALPHADIVALDISEAALSIAKENARRNGVESRIRFMQSDVLAAVAGESAADFFDAIVSNPPYVAESERKTLAPEVRDFEPEIALFAGPSGLEFYQRLFPAAKSALNPGGWLIVEIGHGKRDAIAAMLKEWKNMEFIADLQGIPRVIAARRNC
jgi:release factor glutamine methyltransferase